MQAAIDSLAWLELLLERWGDGYDVGELAVLTGVSPQKIPAQVHALQRSGLPVLEVAGGYGLQGTWDRLQYDEILQHLSVVSQRLLSQLEIVLQLASTNSALMQAARCGAPSGRVCVAEWQTSGRGRRGRQWFSPFGCNVYMSVLWRYERVPASLAGLSLAAGAVVLRALRRAGIDGVRLKWPNDLYYGGAKLGGMLLEVCNGRDGGCAVVLGLGLNTALAAGADAVIDQPWTDLARLGVAVMPRRSRLVGLLLDELLPCLASYRDVGLAAYLEEWRAADALLGQEARFQMGAHWAQGVVQGVDVQGRLLVKMPDGKVLPLVSGEVQLAKPRGSAMPSRHDARSDLQHD